MLREIVRSTTIPLQFGGGMRTVSRSMKLSTLVSPSRDWNVGSGIPENAMKLFVDVRQRKDWASWN